MSRGRSIVVLAGADVGRMSAMLVRVAAARFLTAIGEIELAVLRNEQLTILSPYVDRSVERLFPALSREAALGAWRNPVRALLADVPDADQLLAALLFHRPLMTIDPRHVPGLSAHLLADEGVDRDRLAGAVGPNVAVTPLPDAASGSDAGISLPLNGEARIWRILVINLVSRPLQLALCALINQLLVTGCGVQIAKAYAPETAAHDFEEDDRVEILDFTSLDIAATAWDVVFLGSEIPVFARRFRALEASLILSERPANLFRLELPVAISVNPEALSCSGSADRIDGFRLLPLPGDARVRLVNARMTGRADRAPRPILPLCEELRLHAEILAAKTPFSVLKIASEAQIALGFPLDTTLLQYAAFCRLMGAGKAPDPLPELAIIGMIIEMFGERTAQGFCNRVFEAFLGRPCEESFHRDIDSPVNAAKMIDIVRGVAESEEFSRRMPGRARAIVINAARTVQDVLTTNPSLSPAQMDDGKAVPDAAWQVMHDLVVAMLVRSMANRDEA